MSVDYQVLYIKNANRKEFVKESIYEKEKGNEEREK